MSRHLFKIANLIGSYVVETVAEREERIRACSDAEILLPVRDDDSLQHGVRKCAATQLDLVNAARRLGARGMSLVEIHGQEAVDRWTATRPGVIDAYNAALAAWRGLGAAPTTEAATTDQTERSAS